MSLVSTNGDSVADRYSPILFLKYLEDLLNPILDASPTHRASQVGGANVIGTRRRSSLDVASESDIRYGSSIQRSQHSSSATPSYSSYEAGTTSTVPSSSTPATPFFTLLSCSMQHFRSYITQKCQKYAQESLSPSTVFSGYGSGIIDLSAPCRTVDTAVHAALISAAVSTVFHTILRNLFCCELYAPVSTAASTDIQIPASSNILRTQSSITVLRCWLYILDALGAAMMRDLLNSMAEDEVLLIAESCLDFLLSRREGRDTGVLCSAGGLDSLEGCGKEGLAKDSCTREVNGLLSTYEQCINSTLRSILHNWSELKMRGRSEEARVSGLDGDVERDRTDMGSDSEMGCSSSVSGHTDSSEESEFLTLVQSVRSARTAWVLIGCGDLYNHEVEVAVAAEVDVETVKAHRGSGTERQRDQGDSTQGDRGKG